MYARKEKLLLRGEKSSTVNSCPTHNIVNTCLDVFVVKYVHDITISAFNINQTRKDLQRHLICLTDYNNDYILDGIEGRDKIEYKINVIVEDEC